MIMDFGSSEIWSLIAGFLVGYIVTVLHLSFLEYRKYRPYVMPVRSEHYLVMEALMDLKVASKDKQKRQRITELMREIDRRSISRHPLKRYLRHKPS